jgi:hypothetical protein
MHTILGDKIIIKLYNRDNLLVFDLVSWTKIVHLLLHHQGKWGDPQLMD